MAHSDQASRIFEAYKAIGFVSNEVPFIIRYVQKLDDIRIVTCVGRSFHSYSSRLKMLETCHQHQDDISALASDSIYVFSAAGNNVYAWKHGHRWLVHKYTGHEAKVKFLLPFAQHIISVDEKSTVRICEIKTEELYAEIPFDNGSFEITAVMHPATYMNKILLGSRQGHLQLWNVRTQKLIYEFSGWNSPVTAIEQAPAVDIVAIGLSDGRIVVHNLKIDETLMSFYQEWGPVTSISFRLDGKPFMVTAGTSGNVAIWDLEKRRIASQMRDLHSGPVTCCRFINNEPLLVTSSPDNSIKIWIFDQSDDSGRLLYERQGHSQPPTKIKFYGSRGYHILSAGLDSTLRCFSTLSERLNRNFGFASFDRKYAKKIGVSRDPNRMPPIVDFTTELTREKEWDNIAACHKGLAITTTWSFNRAKMGERKLLHQRFKERKNIIALCICLSACGNFVTIGYNTGHIDRFNIQSGLHRQQYGQDIGHEGAVRGIISDGLNQLVVTGGADCALKFWHFKTGQLRESKTFDSPINQIIQNRDNSLIAVAFDNFDVKVVDLETSRSIRSFSTHDSPIVAMTFSNDARWLIVAAADKTLRVWDLPRGQLVDKFAFYSPCTSLSMSPTGEFLASTHQNDLGVYLWSNVTLFAPISLRPLSEESDVKTIGLPQVKVDVEGGDEDGEEEHEEGSEDESEGDEDNMEADEEAYRSPEQLSKELITLSQLPSSRWKNLLNIDLIKKRNKPKEPPQAPKAAPFFLPTITGLNPTFDKDAAKSKDAESRLLPLKTLSPFGELLIDCSASDDYQPVLDHLKQLGPSAIDAELRSLDVPLPIDEEGQMGNEENDTRPILMSYFLHALRRGLQSKQDFELVQSYLALFLKQHTDTILKDRQLQQECCTILDTLDMSWDNLQMKFHSSLCIINYLRSILT